MNTNTIIEETLPQAGLLEGNLAYQNDFETDKDNEFLAAIENLSGILGRFGGEPVLSLIHI
mgnify:CR=1 FL=1